MKSSLTSLRMLLTIALTITSVPASGQTSDFPEQGERPLQPNLKRYPEIPGWRAAFLQGTTDSAGQRFIVPSLDILQAVSIMLITPDTEPDVRLQLYKDNYKELIGEESTKGTAAARVMIRTQGPVRLVVKSMEATSEYQLAIWVSDEVPVVAPSLFVPMSQAGKPILASNQAGATGDPSGAATPAGGGSGLAMWFIAGALVVIALLLALLVLRRKKGQATAAIVVLSVALLQGKEVVAQAPPPLPPPPPPPVNWRLDAKAKAAAHEAAIKKAMEIDPNYFGFNYDKARESIQKQNNDFYNQGKEGYRAQVGNPDKVSPYTKTYPAVPPAKPAPTTIGTTTVVTGGIFVPEGGNPIGVYELAKTQPALPAEPARRCHRR